MLINFQHNDHIATCFLIYNPSQVQNAFLLIPVKEKTTLTSKIFIYKNINQWKTTSLIKVNFPETFQSIIRVIEGLLPEKENNTRENINGFI